MGGTRSTHGKDYKFMKDDRKTRR